mgnify:CR=1 FL=1
MPSQNAVIPEGASASNDIELSGAVAGVIQMPAAFTGTTVEIKFSIDGATFTTVVEEANEVNPITFAASGTYAIPIKAFSGKYMQLLSNGTEAEARTFPVFLRMRP